MRLRIALTSVFALALVLGSSAVATATGQPSQTCLSSTAPNEPGQAASAPGSAFNETGPRTARTAYAGNAVSATTPASANAVSQYDVAWFQVPQPWSPAD